MKHRWLALAMAGTLFGTQFNNPAASAAEVVAGNTAFALDLFRREGERAGNLFFSPYSISTALAMTAAGARGQTGSEMAKVLHLEGAQPDVAGGFAQLAKRFRAISDKKLISLNVANSLWCEQRYKFNAAFLDLNRKYYGAEVRAMDFAHQPDKSRESINTWIADQTHDKIRDLLQPPQVTPATTLVLCNAIYFKGAWVTKFDPKSTRSEPFFLTRDQRVDVPMMNASFKVRSHRTDDAIVFSLPYAGADLDMIVVLPNEVDGLGAVEKKWTAGGLQSWFTALDQAEETKAIVALPKFKLNCRLALASQLKAMGMPTAFGGSADFSGISTARDLFISDVVHQAFVDVNEEGTEAAAATAVVMTRSVARDQPLMLRADHPFLFLIRERQTGSILFLGRLADPRS